MYLLVVKYISKCAETLLLMALRLIFWQAEAKGEVVNRGVDSLKYLLVLTNGTKNNILSLFFLFSFFLVLVFFILLLEWSRKLFEH